MSVWAREDVSIKNMYQQAGKSEEISTEKEKNEHPKAKNENVRNQTRSYLGLLLFF